MSYRRRARKAPGKKAQRPKGKRMVNRHLGVKYAKQVVNSASLGAQTYSRCKMSHGAGTAKTKAITLVGQRQRHVFNQYSQVRTNASEQGSIAYSIAHQAQLTKVADYYQSSPAATAGTVIAPSTYVAVPPNEPARYVLQNIALRHTISNSTNTPVQCMIFDIECKRDTQNTMTYTSPAAVDYVWDGGPQGAWEQGLLAASDVTITPPSPKRNVWGVDPWESPIFNRFFKINKQTTVNLAVGAIHKHDCEVEYNRLLDASVYANTPSYGFKGLSHFQMFVVRGAPGTIVNPTTGGTFATTVGEAKLDILSEYEINFTFGASYCQTLYVGDALSAPAEGQYVNTMTVGLPTSAPVKTNDSI